MLPRPESAPERPERKPPDAAAAAGTLVASELDAEAMDGATGPNAAMLTAAKDYAGNDGDNEGDTAPDEPIALTLLRGVLGSVGLLLRGIGCGDIASILL